MEILSAISSGEGWVEYGGSFDAPVTWGELLFYVVGFGLGYWFWLRKL